MNTITVTYLIRKPGNVIEMLIRGEEILLTRNGKELGKITPTNSTAFKRDVCFSSSEDET
jgi:hypothetical protein